jgi:uncharacterized membrane protein YccF (DUF307 family)
MMARKIKRATNKGVVSVVQIVTFMIGCFLAFSIVGIPFAIGCFLLIIIESFMVQYEVVCSNCDDTVGEGDECYCCGEDLG